jgi:hypothetical protein
VPDSRADGKMGERKSMTVGSLVGLLFKRTHTHTHRERPSTKGGKFEIEKKKKTGSEIFDALITKISAKSLSSTAQFHTSKELISLLFQGLHFINFGGLAREGWDLGGNSSLERKRDPCRNWESFGSMTKNVIITVNKTLHCF